jgi:hypothetical protein
VGAGLATAEAHEQSAALVEALLEEIPVPV